MNVKECDGCPFFGEKKMRCYYDVEMLSGDSLDEFTVCRWSSRRLKNQRDRERKQEQRNNKNHERISF